MITNKEIYKAYRMADNLANSKPAIENTITRIKQLIIVDPVCGFLKLLRKTEYLKNCKKGMIGEFIYLYHLWKFKNLSRKLGFTIPLNVFGPGLSIPHYGTIVVNSTAKVGKNCRLHVCVNIGASGGSTFAPKIGDNVYIGPGAILFGDIVIADKVTIAANATVNRSFEVPNVTIGGTPAKILFENSSDWLDKNRLDL